VTGASATTWARSQRTCARCSTSIHGAIGVADITALALDLCLVGYDPARRARAPRPVEHQLERLAALTLEERRRVPGLEPERAPVIVAGTVVLREVLDRYALDAIEVSEHDILHGAALAAAELPALEEGDAPPGAYTCC
jgi:hypothetical protein